MNIQAAAQLEIDENLRLDSNRVTLCESVTKMIIHLEMILPTRSGLSKQDTERRLLIEREMLNLLSK